MPHIPDLTAIQWNSQTATALAALLAILLWLAVRALTKWARRRHVTADDMLTVVAAAVAAAFGAQGMWGFFRATLLLPIPLTALGFTMFELVMLTCALRARRNLLGPDKTAGVEGTVLWLFAGMAGFFSATHAHSWAEALFRGLVPSIAAWLWHRLMRLEHRRTVGRLDGIHWRITPERILTWLRLADPTDRTAAQVSVEHTLMTLAIATRKARNPARGWGWLARRRLDKALRRATQYAQLATNPASQELLITTLGVLNSADALIALTPPSPWLAATSAADDGSEATIRRMVEAGMVEVNDRTRALLGLSATTPQPPQPGWSPSRLFVVSDSALPPAVTPSLNQSGNHATNGATAGQDADAELSATIRATIRDAAAKGLGERAIAKQVGVTRDRVRVELDRPRRGRLGRRQPAPDAQPASAAINSDR